MHYDYLIQSLAEEKQRYIGLTVDLKQRLADHNAGRSPHTKKFKPWRLVTYIAFSEVEKAAAFEMYLKQAPATLLRPNAFGNPRDDSLPKIH